MLEYPGVLCLNFGIWSVNPAVPRALVKWPETFICSRKKSDRYLITNLNPFFALHVVFTPETLFYLNKVAFRKEKKMNRPLYVKLSTLLFKINWHDFSPEFPLFSGAYICDGSPIDVANSRALFLFYIDQ